MCDQQTCGEQASRHDGKMVHAVIVAATRPLSNGRILTAIAVGVFGSKSTRAGHMRYSKKEPVRTAGRHRLH